MKSMDEIYREYADLVYRFILARVRDESIAEEITQETFFQAIKSSNRFDESCKVSTWLCGIAKNLINAYLRKNPDHEYIEGLEIEAGNTPTPEKVYLEQESRMSLMKELHKIPEPYREVLYLRVFGDLSFREIGEIMEKSENWARVTFYRGKDRIKMRKEDWENEYKNKRL